MFSSTVNGDKPIVVITLLNTFNNVVENLLLRHLLYMLNMVEFDGRLTVC